MLRGVSKFLSFFFLFSVEIRPNRERTFGLRSVPTHTEDGIPIRKLYVSNLPSKVSRNIYLR